MTITIKDIVRRTWLAKAVKDESASEHEMLQQQAVEQYHADGVKKYEFDFEDKHVTGTLVEGTRGVLDIDALRQAIPEEMWNKITMRVLDQDLLKAHVLVGDIDINLVERCTELKPSKAFLKFTVKEGVASAAPIKKARKSTAKGKKR